MTWPRDDIPTTTEWALRERVKELACLYEMARLLGDPQTSTTDKIEGIIEVIPPAWQHPSCTVARITLDSSVIESTHFSDVKHSQNAVIMAHGEPRGMVEVGYTCEGLAVGLGNPFLKEEHDLIENIARQIGIHVERMEIESHRRNLEEQLRHSDRLATIGQLAAGVAHEMNEPLGNILGFAQLAMKTPNLSDQLDRDLQQIVDAALGAREIVKKLLLFARQAPPHKTSCNLNTIVDETLFLLEATGARRGIDFTRCLEVELPDVEADPVQVRQVIVNLVVNAIQAITGPGTITLVTRTDQDRVELQVVDTGCGMTSDVLSHILDPFFTTKEIGEGTGLGLAVVHGIVTAHGGTIHATSEPDNGSCFVVQLPRAGHRTDSQETIES